MLTLNSLVGAALGFAFWIVAAHRFSPADIGFASAAVAGAGLIQRHRNGRPAQHVPPIRSQGGGPGGRRSWCAEYTVASITTAALGSLLVLAASRFDSDTRSAGSGQLDPVVRSRGADLVDILASGRRPDRAPPRAIGVDRGHGSVVGAHRPALHGSARRRSARHLPGVASSAIFAVLLISPYLALSARSAAGKWPSLRARSSGRDMLRYYAGATVGSIALILQISAMPVIVVAASGVSANARFYLPWAIGTSLQLVSSSMASPLAAEIARGIEDERRQVKRVLSHCIAAMTAVAVPLYFVAPPVIGRLGDSYRVEKPLFALLLLAALLNAVPRSTSARARARGDVTGSRSRAVGGRHHPPGRLGDPLADRRTGRRRPGRGRSAVRRGRDRLQARCLRRSGGRARAVEWERVRIPSSSRCRAWQLRRVALAAAWKGYSIDCDGRDLGNGASEVMGDSRLSVVMATPRFAPEVGRGREPRARGCAEAPRTWRRRRRHHL